MVLAACGGDPPPPATPLAVASPPAATAHVATPTHATTAAQATSAGAPATPSLASPVASPVAGVGAIIWTRAVDATTKEPEAPVAAFAADDVAIYAAVPLSALPSDTALSAAWSYNGTPLGGFAPALAVETDDRRRWAEFHLSRAPDAQWPLGTYAIEVRVDGATVQTAAVEVVAGGG